MIGWFANAIMAGVDSQAPRISNLERALSNMVENGDETDRAQALALLIGDDA